MSKLYSLYDKRARTYGKPWTDLHDVQAIRHVTAAVQNTDPNNMLAKHHADYELYCVGDFNEDTGDITPEQRLLAKCSDLLPEHRQE